MNSLSLNFLGIPEKKEKEADIPPQNTYLDPKQLTKPKAPLKSMIVNKLDNMKNKKNDFKIEDGESVKEIVKKIIVEKPSLKKLRETMQHLVNHYEEDSDDEF